MHMCRHVQSDLKRMEQVNKTIGARFPLTNVLKMCLINMSKPSQTMSKMYDSLIAMQNPLPWLVCVCIFIYSCIPDCLTRGNEIQFERMDCLIRGNELSNSRERIAIRENELSNSRERIINP